MQEWCNTTVWKPYFWIVQSKLPKPGLYALYLFMLVLRHVAQLTPNHFLLCLFATHASWVRLQAEIFLGWQVDWPSAPEILANSLGINLTDTSLLGLCPLSGEWHSIHLPRRPSGHNI